MINIAVIGNLGHLDCVFDELEYLAECQVTAVCSAGDMKPSRTLAVLNRSGRPAPEIFEDHRTMIDNAPCDIVVVASPFEDHCAICCYAIEHHKAVFTEKPAVITLEELLFLEKTVKQHNGILYHMVGIHFTPHFHTAFKLICDGVIGQIKLISARKSYKFGNRAQYYFKRETYGGTIPWVGIHAIDWIARCNAGSFTAVRAIQHYGEKSCSTLETAAHCLFTLDSGAIASVDIDLMRPAGAVTHGDDRLRIAGEKGVIEVFQGKVELITEEGTTYPELETPPLGCFSKLVYDLQDQSPDLVSETELTLKVTRAALTAQASADRNCELSV